jgi:hypothetical protein
LFDENQDVWLASAKMDSIGGYNGDLAWNELFRNVAKQEKELPQKNQKSFQWRTLFQAAAVVAIAFLAGVVSMHFFNPGRKSATPSVTEHFVPYGSRSMVILPDGTKIWLNAGSKLTYSQEYNVNSREVNLTGEAYFDVKANPKYPFCVHTSYINVKVVGTAFNIKAYPEERVVETTVERGQVVILSRGKLLTLKPRQKAYIYQNPDETKNEEIKKDSGSLTVQKKNQKADTLEFSHFEVTENVETSLSTSWKDKRWIIEREELGSLAVKIGRRYDVSIDFATENLRHFIFSGAIEDESLDQVLKVIRFTSPISYSINKKKVELREDLFLKENLGPRR